MKFDSRDLSLTVVFAGLYAVVNMVQTMLGGPITYGPVQLRVADCLIALSALLGWPTVAGVTIGCFVGNIFYLPSLYGVFGSLALVDAIVGPIVNFIAASLVLLCRKRRLTACVIGALTVGIIVGGYLWLMFLPPEILGFLPMWIASIVSITISSLIAIAVIGYSLLIILSRPKIIEPLKSRGLKVVKELMKQAN